MWEHSCSHTLSEIVHVIILLYNMWEYSCSHTPVSYVRAFMFSYSCILCESIHVLILWWVAQKQYDTFIMVMYWEMMGFKYMISTRWFILTWVASMLVCHGNQVCCHGSAAWGSRQLWWWVALMCCLHRETQSQPALSHWFTAAPPPPSATTKSHLTAVPVI